MAFPKQLFKNPGVYGLGHRTYDVAGAEDEAQEAELLKKGWFLTLEEALGKKAKADPLDHDGNGKAGGSLPKARRAARKPG